ncbi:MAG: hypothetical protein AAGH79_00850 [Bacteroidota bacterium]
MKLSYYLFAVLIVGCIFSCTPPQYSYGELPEVRIHFGAGGGVAGLKSEFILLENGQVFRSVAQPTGKVLEQEELKPNTKREAKDYFKRLDSMRIVKYDFFHPDNYYYFLRMVDDQIDHKLEWGDLDHPVRVDVQSFYQDLQKMVDGRPGVASNEEEVKKEEEEGGVPEFEGWE